VLHNTFECVFEVYMVEQLLTLRLSACTCAHT